jgi:hypothetical protein
MLVLAKLKEESFESKIVITNKKLACVNIILKYNILKF